mgnify:CR=1 FL=1
MILFLSATSPKAADLYAAARTWIKESEDKALPIEMRFRALDIAEELIKQARTLK